jgi:two-component system sensor histidine kinase YesM
MILAFLLYLAYIQRIIITPMHRLTRGMGALGKGNMRVTLPESGADEMRYLIRSFNDMTTQLETLRIENYEKRLQAQHAELETKKAELRSMQLQINPHFFANSLNIIYSLSAIRDYQTIQQMALLLSRYFRYIMRSDEA